MRYFSLEPPLQTGERRRIVGPDVKHIRNVLRLKAGNGVMVTDGSGYEYEAQITAVAAKHVELLILDRSPSRAESTVRITAAQAFLKDKKMDLLVRQLTELGISRWIPFVCERSVPRPEKKRLAARTARWRKIAGEAIKQCRRERLPEIADMMSFGDLVALGGPYEKKLIFWEDETRRLPQDLPARNFSDPGEILMVVGPEGGFSDEEIEQAEKSGFSTVGLGPRILRAETAAIVACALIQYVWGDLGEKNLDKKQPL